MLWFLVLASLVACSLGGAVFKRPRLDGRIAGGRPVTIDKFPFQVSYEYGGSHICGGSIISQYWVVTAAQCTDGRAEISSRFRAGSSKKETGGTLHHFAQIIQHPKYECWTSGFDVSLVRVSDLFAYGSGVAAIALAEIEPLAGVLSTVSGWGANIPAGSFVTDLQAVDVEIIPHLVCDNAYAEYGGITDNMICAGGNGGGKGACSGDTGGPLVVRGILVGIMSWGFGCVNDEFPGVYTNIANIRNFIP